MLVTCFLMEEWFDLQRSAAQGRHFRHRNVRLVWHGKID